jgi:short-subunit dehydrogenase
LLFLGWIIILTAKYKTRYLYMKDFNQNVVVITGASSGIGKELALQLAEKKAWLVIAARNIQKLEEVKNECKKFGGRVLTVRTDVADKEQCKNLIDETIKEYGRIDTLINNAGITMWTKFEDITDIDLFEKIMRVNYLGSVYCTYYALPFLKESKGRLVGISSLTGKTGVPTRTAYSASKHAMAGFFDSLRIELADSGVSVIMIYPGFVDTEIRGKELGADGNQIGENKLVNTKTMNVKTCTEIIVNAVAKRKREVVMTMKGKLGIKLKLISPSLVDKIAQKAIIKNS